MVGKPPRKKKLLKDTASRPETSLKDSSEAVNSFATHKAKNQQKADRVWGWGIREVLCQQMTEVLIKGVTKAARMWQQMFPLHNGQDGTKMTRCGRDYHTHL